MCDVSAVRDEKRASDLCVRVPGKDEEETVADLEEVDEDDVDGEPSGMGGDRRRVETDDVDWAGQGQVEKEGCHAQMDGLTMDAQTSTQTMLAESDSGVSTCSLPRGSAYGAHTGRRLTGRGRATPARRGWTCRRPWWKGDNR